MEDEDESPPSRSADTGGCGHAEESPPGPDAVDLVVEAADMVTVFAAHRYRVIEAARRDAAADCQRRGRSFDQLQERALRFELACAMRITEHAAGALMAAAYALVNLYPTVLASMERAAVSQRHAEVLVDLVGQAAPAVRERVVPQALALAERLPVGTFRKELAALIAVEENPTLVDRFGRAVGKRRAVVEDAEDGMSWLMTLMPAVEAHAAYDRATAHAKILAQRPSETRTLDQLRADVIADLLIDGHSDDHPDAVRGVRATVAVTVPALALLETGSDGQATAGPATVEGVGPIPIDRARELCGGDGGWMRVLTHPETGTVLSVSRTRYRPPKALRRLARWRSERCMAPGCVMPAARCELDHTHAWAYGGQTSLANLTPLCKGHHTVKHHSDWRVASRDGGGLEWTSPTGRHYVVEPTRPLPTFTVTPDAAAAPF